jgi:hypothetical protein
MPGTHCQLNFDRFNWEQKPALRAYTVSVKRNSSSKTSSESRLAIRIKTPEFLAAFLPASTGLIDFLWQAGGWDRLARIQRMLTNEGIVRRTAAKPLP